MFEDSTFVNNLNGYINNIALVIGLYSIIVSILGAFKLTQWFILLHKTRFLRKIWGFKNNDTVLVICSELDRAHTRQNLDPREFYYHFKYGDVDAYFETIVTLLRLYPKLKLKVMSSGEAASTIIDLSQNLVLIGGPDFNKVTELILSENNTLFGYLSPESPSQSSTYPDEIALLHKKSMKEYCHTTSLKDYGYFEKIVNHLNPNKHIVIIGGCHSMGVTSAIKAFSLLNSEHDEMPQTVKMNSKLLAKKLKSRSMPFAILVEAERIGQTIGTPRIKNENIWLNDRSTNH
ncbi:MAG TPA: hypothetical protein PLW77_05715 [Bacteroidales bacterium]|nr:hypothetical protein [Bacteroidales bacterium]HQB21401.1 hypothetical protein [Bacteroidales bacterium]